MGGLAFLFALICSQYAASDISSPSFNHSRVSPSLLISQTLQSISKKWNIDEFPSFLTASYISNLSWNEMKSKLQDRLHRRNSSFVISFLGAGVTVGYDVSHDLIFSVLLEKILQPAFSALEINLVIRNVGIGGNLCTPYGICVNTFAGWDADMIIWEHSFDCGFSECGFVLEQFVRQALQSPSRPILSFALSLFPNWYPPPPLPVAPTLFRKAKECKELMMRPKPPLSEEYTELLSTWRSHGISSVAQGNRQLLGKVTPPTAPLLLMPSAV
jgi:hypothetical protein